MGILFVVKRRCSVPRGSLAEGDSCEPTLRSGLVKGAKGDDSSRGDLKAERSPNPVEKAILLVIHWSTASAR